MKQTLLLLAVCLVAISGCKKDTSADLTACFDFAPTSPTIYSDITFSNCSKNETSYLWDFGDGTGSSSEKAPVYQYTASGTYTVKLTVSKAGESKSTTKQIVVKGATKDDYIGTYNFNSACSGGGNSFTSVITSTGGNNLSISNADNSGLAYTATFSDFNITIPAQSAGSGITVSGTGSLNTNGAHSLNLYLTYTAGGVSSTCSDYGVRQ